MVDIIGVNHCINVDEPSMVGFGGTTSIAVPIPSENLLRFIHGRKIGLEAIPKQDLVKLQEQFYFPDGPSENPKKLLGLYNPLSQDYFHKLHSTFPNCVLLDSVELNQKMVSIAKEYGNKNSRINSMINNANPTNMDHFVICYDLMVENYEYLHEDMDVAEAYDLHELNQSKNYVDGNLFINRFKLETSALKINAFERDSHLLENILNSDVDVAIVGLHHAMNWKEKGIDFNYWMEHSQAGLPFQPLDEEKVEYDRVLFNSNLEWRLSFDNPKRFKPLYMGLRGSFTPETYFEIYEGVDGLFMLDSRGKTNVQIEKKNDDFIISENSSTYVGKKTRHGFQGLINNFYLSPFLIVEYSGTPFEMMEDVYDIDEFRVNFKEAKQIYFPEITNPIPDEVEHLHISPDYYIPKIKKPISKEVENSHFAPDYDFYDDELPF